MKIFKRIIASIMLITMMVFYLPYYRVEAIQIVTLDGGIVDTKAEGERKMLNAASSSFDTIVYFNLEGVSTCTNGNEIYKYYFTNQDGKILCNYTFMVRNNRKDNPTKQIMYPTFVNDQIKKYNQSKNDNKNNYKNNNKTDSDSSWDSYENYDNEYNSSSVQPEPEQVTVCANKVSMEMKSEGIYEFKIEFDNNDAYLNVKKAPTFKVKIGDKSRTLAYVNSGINYLKYRTKIEDVKLGGKQVTIDSISGGDVELKRANTITTMDYTSKMTNKNIGTIEKFIIVNKDAKGDVNGDERLDKLDVDSLQKCTDKKIADLNGDSKINSDDKDALKRAIEEQDLIYIRFITVGKDKQHNGDVCNTSGESKYDGIINYKDYEYLARAVANNRKITYGDVNGDGKVNVKDVTNVKKALQTGNEGYLHYIKVNDREIVGDLNNDGVINIDDVFALAKKPSNGDINGDGKIDARDQATLLSALVNEDAKSLMYITVPKGAKGDIDGNCIINKADAEKLAQLLSQKNLDSEIDKNIADVNGDGKVNSRDAAYIRNGLENQDINNEAYITLMSYGFSVKTSENDAKGDVNEDGVVNAIDARLLAKYLAGSIKEKEINKENADFNNDGKVNVRDSAKMMQELKKLQTSALEGEDPVEEDENIGANIEEEILYGDVNLDGAIGLADLIEIAKYCLNSTLFPLDDKQLLCADLNQDGKVDTLDTEILAEYNLGNVITLPLSKTNK